MKTRITAIITAILIAISMTAIEAGAAEVSSSVAVSPKRLPKKKALKRAQNTGEKLPSSYSSRELGYCSSVKNQVGDTCWAFASLGSFETYMLKNNIYTTDYDPNLLDLWGTSQPNGFGWQRDVRESGSTYIPIGNFTSWSGPLSVEGEIPKYGVTELTYLGKGDNDAVKREIMKNGAVTGNLMTYGRGYSKDRNAFCITDNINISSGHSISVVGWDDSYSRENFTGNYLPQNDGAWLCKYSWGDKYNSNGGYIWVSYEDYFLFSSEHFDPSFSVDRVREIKSSDHIYQNEIYGATYEFSYIESDDITYFNVFDFSEEGNVLESVVFETLALGAEYKVYSVPLNENEEPTDDKTQWTLLGEGKIEHTGYIPCDTKNSILRRSKLAIAVELNTSGTDSTNCVGVSEWLREADTKKMFFIDPVQKGHSFVTYEDKIVDVKDFYENELQDDNGGGTLVIKAITNNKTEAKYLGDVDLNGELNIKDATELQKFLADIISIDDDAMKNADFNQDGKLNILDVTSLRKFLAKVNNDE